MDNRSASRVGVAVNAKAFTEEIDRVTTPMAEPELPAPGLKVSPDTLATPDVQRLGGAAIFSTPERDNVAGVEIASELARDEDEALHAEKYVGAESQLQVRERLAEDQADLQAEMGVGDPLTVKIMAKSQEELSRAMMPMVNKIVNQPSFRPADLEKVYRDGAEKARGLFGRKLGERN